MKTNLYRKWMLSAFLLAAFSSSKAQWSEIPTGIPGGIEQIVALTEDTIFIKTNNLYRTFDGGVTFQEIVIPDVQKVSQIDFVNTRVGVAAANNEKTHVVEIFLTENSGSEWRKITPVDHWEITDVAFANRNHGIVMLAPKMNHTEGFYNYTGNGGQSWELVGPLVGYYFLDADFQGLTGYAIAKTFAADEPSMIMKTADGGKSFQPVYVSQDTLNSFQGIQVFSSSEAIAYVNDAENLNAILYHTQNGGQSWNRKIFPGHILDISFATGLNGLIIDDRGIIFRTINGGETWWEDRPADDQIQTVAAVETIGFAGGVEGKFLKRSMLNNINEIANDEEGGSAYPNPSPGSVIIPTDLFGSMLNIEVKDISGKIVDSKKIKGYHDTVKLDELPKGVLFISVTDEYNQYKIFKVVVE